MSKLHILSLQSRSRMMAQPLDLFVRLPRRSFMAIARRVHAQEGFRGFFRGLGPTYLRAFPSNASAFFVYESIMRGLGAEKVNRFSTFGGMLISLNSHPDSSLTNFRTRMTPRIICCLSTFLVTA